MAAAVRRIVRTGVQAEEITPQLIGEYLERAEMPDPDLVIRTAGECRLSNFMIWRLAYAELVFTDVLWPDFSETHLRDAVAEFQNRSRRFGGPATTTFEGA